MVARPANFRHVAIDMQRLVAEETAWHSPIVMNILPNVIRLGSGLRAQTLYARFVAPANVQAADGCWKTFYRRWSMITGDILDPDLLDLVPPLAELAEPDHVFDKRGYSIFSNPDLDGRLRADGVETLILSGIETDVCVFSSALAAIDLGYSVVLAADALASPSETAHQAILTQVATRLPEQIRIMATDEILDHFAS